MINHLRSNLAGVFGVLSAITGWLVADVDFDLVAKRTTVILTILGSTVLLLTWALKLWREWRRTRLLNQHCADCRWLKTGHSKT